MMITILPAPKLLCAAAGVLLGLLPVTWAQDTAVDTTLPRFAGTDGSIPTEWVEGSDGNFYDFSTGQIIKK